MKRTKAIISISALLAALAFTTPVYANENASAIINREEFVFQRGEVTIKVNGLKMDDLSTSAFLYEGGVFVDPVELLGNFGAEIAAEEGACQISYLGKTIFLEINSLTGFLDGTPIPIAASPTIVDGNLMIPLRFAAAAFGFKTDWEPETKTVSLEIPIDRQALLDMATKETIKIEKPLEILSSAVAKEETRAVERKFTVALDAGHGGGDSGATGHGLYEKDLNDDIARRVAELAAAGGAFDVRLTKNAGEFLSLGARASVGNEYGDVFISIHNNSSNGGYVSGTETHYLPHYNDAELGFSCEELARIMQRHLVDNLGSVNRGVFVSNFAVLRETTIPAALLEIGFISNSYEASLLGTPEYRQNAAQAIYNGLLEVYEVYGK
jgi:N-acetylmuramoyl-L-alanine amidase